MGQKLSLEEQRGRKQHVYAYFPGLSQQLEMTFSCHDMNSKGSLPYATLEPILRHLLMQYGLIEYVVRFIDLEGSLDWKHIQTEAYQFGLRPGNVEHSCEDFKSLAVIWLQKILDTYADDQAEWQEKVRLEQSQQAEAYMSAMKSFQAQYSTQEALYQQGLQEQQKQISEWNKLLEETHRTQQEVYEAEVKRIEEIKQRELNAAEEAAKEHQRVIDEYKNQLESLAKNDPNGICFIYPASSCPFGACASAGAQEPHRRKRPARPSKKPIANMC